MTIRSINQTDIPPRKITGLLARYKYDGMNEAKTKVLIVEDHEITRLGIVKMLNKISRIHVVGEACKSDEAMRKYSELSPDVVLMDLGLPGNLDGIQLTKLIKDGSSCKVVVLTVHDTEEEIQSALTAGADGYCLKSIGDQEFERAIACVIDGGTWLDPAISIQVKKLLTQKPAEKSLSPKDDLPLSEREQLVLSLLVEGLTNRQMAKHLNLSPETIKTHMKHLMAKLAVSDRTQAAVKALKQGLTSQLNSPAKPEMN